MVYPAWRDGEGEFVVEDGLERGDDLGLFRRRRREDWVDKNIDEAI